MRLSLGKHILIVEAENGPLAALEPRLRELGLVVLRASTASAATELVATTGLLSLVAIDDGIGVDAGGKLLATIKQDHPDLPIVWVSSRPATAPLSRSEFMPDAILHHPIDVESLRSDVDRLLLEQLYPPELVGLLSQACRDVMKAAYGVELHLRDQHIRANRNALGTINAILPFCGRHISGRVVVGAERTVLAAIRASILAKAEDSLSAAEDLAGEYANLVAGRMKAHFAEYHFDFELGTPIFLTGPQIGVRYRASRPALVLTLTHGGDPILVSFCFDTIDAGRIRVGDEDTSATAASGDMQFL